MLNRLERYILEQHLFPNGQEVLLAVSGGRDSVAMAHLMHRLGVPFAIAHCNFHLRPGDCDRDEAFVRRLAESMGVKIHTAHFDTLSYAHNGGYSVEEAARLLRYDFFARLCASEGYACVATAHHRDDSIETFFLNLFRGTGIAGLHGIRPTSQLNINNTLLLVVRPMLCFSRAEIDGYIASEGLEYVEDSTNAETDVRRNRIRLQLMPLLRELYPSVDATMEANIGRLQDTEKVYRLYIEELRQRLVQPYRSAVPTLAVPMYVIALDEIRQLDPQRTLLFELLRPFGFNAAVVDDILASLDGRAGALFRSPSHNATLTRTHLQVVSNGVSPTPSVDTAVLEGPFDRASLKTGNTTLMVDADTVAEPLTLRQWSDGDRFVPFGMEHSRLVSDFLTDLHLSRLEKEHVWLLEDANGQIIWVVGLRADNQFRITAATRRALRIILRES